MKKHLSLALAILMFLSCVFTPAMADTMPSFTIGPDGRVYLSQETPAPVQTEAPTEAPAAQDPPAGEAPAADAPDDPSAPSSEEPAAEPASLKEAVPSSFTEGYVQVPKGTKAYRSASTSSVAGTFTEENVIYAAAASSGWLEVAFVNSNGSASVAVVAYIPASSATAKSPLDNQALKTIYANTSKASYNGYPLPGIAFSESSAPSTATPAPAPVLLDVTVNQDEAHENDTLVFTVSVSGVDGSQTYQWQRARLSSQSFENCGLGGSQTATLTFAATEARLKYKYRCAVTYQGVVYNTTALSVAFIADPTPAPEDITVTASVSASSASAGTKVYYTAAVAGATDTPAYQWQKSADGVSGWKNSKQSGSTTAKMTITASESLLANYYRCVVTVNGTTVFSNVVKADFIPDATVTPTVTPTATPTSAPAGNVTVSATASAKKISAGELLYFRAAVSGASETPSYQWQKSTDKKKWTSSQQNGNKTAEMKLIASESLVSGLYYRCAVTVGGNDYYSNIVSVQFIPYKPVITAAASVSAAYPGEVVYFTADVTGAEGTPTYQWQKSDDGKTGWSKSAQNGNGTAQMKLTASESLLSKYYRCQVTDDNYTWYSPVVKVNLIPKAKVTASVSPATASLNTKVYFTVTAENTSGSLTYQWQKNATGDLDNEKNWTNSSQSGNKTAKMTITGTEALLSGVYYRCVVTDSNRSWESNAVKAEWVAAPVIKASSAKVTSLTGSVTLTAEVTGGTSGNTFQWQQKDEEATGWTGISGATALTLSVTGEDALSHAYRLMVKNEYGTWYSDPVQPAAAKSLLAVKASPAKQAAFAGDWVYITGTVPYTKGEATYQWQKSEDGETGWGNSAQSGSKTTQIKFKAAANLCLYYRLVVKDDLGTRTSNAVKVNLVEFALTASASQATASKGTKVYYTASLRGIDASETYTYQWQKSADGETGWSNSAQSGSKTAKMTITGQQSLIDLYYRCAVTYSGGTVYSNVVKVTWMDPPVITAVTDVARAVAGQVVHFDATVTGVTENAKYQWQKSAEGKASSTDWSNSQQSGYKTANLKMTASESLLSYYYRLRVIDDNGTWYSNIVKVAYIPAPTVTASVAPALATEGTAVKFSVTTEGTQGTLSYQWQESEDGKSWSNTASATAASMKVTASAEALAKYYRCAVTDANKTWYSNAVQAVFAPIKITVSGAPSVQAPLGDTVILTASVTGAAGTPAYQWQKSADGKTSWGGSSQNGAKSLTLTFTASESLCQYYRLRVTDDNGTWYSDPILVKLVPKVTVTTDAQDGIAVYGDRVTFTATVKGADDSVSYRWQKNTVDPSSEKDWTNSSQSGATTLSMSLTASSSLLNAWYRIRGADSHGTWYSEPVYVSCSPKITVTATPEIAVQFGEIATLTAAVTGAAGEITYQWQKSADGQTSWANSSQNGNKTATLKFTASETLCQYYRVRVKDGAGTWYSEPVLVKLIPKAVITSDAENGVATYGDTVNFTATVKGADDTATYRWQKNTVDPSSEKDWSNSSQAGAASLAMHLTASDSLLNAWYRIRGVDSHGTWFSEPIYISCMPLATVKASTKTASSANTGTLQASSGETVTFKATVKGVSGTVSYQWQKSTDNRTWKNSAQSGSKTATMTLVAQKSLLNAWYRVVCTDDHGTWASDGVYVSYRPLITISANMTTAKAGDKVVFSSTVKGTTGDLTYQWQKSADGETAWSNSSQSGSKTAEMTITATEALLNNYYRLMVKDDDGTWYSGNTVKVAFINETFTISPSGTVTLSGSGASETNVDITSNTSWKAESNQTWLTVGTKSGSGNATVKLSAAANTSSSARTATVTFTYGPSNAAVTLKVTQPRASILVTSVTIDQDPTTYMTMGDTLQLTATVLPDNASNRALEWYYETVHSTGANGLTVDAGGKVRANYPGKYRVYAKAADGSDIDDYINIYVKPKTIPVLSIDRVGGRTINISWNNVAGAGGYVIRYRKQGASSWAEIEIRDALTTSYSLTRKPGYTTSRLEENTSYEIAVCAYDGNNTKTCTEYCATQTVKTATPTRYGYDYGTITQTSIQIKNIEISNNTGTPADKLMINCYWKDEDDEWDDGIWIDDLPISTTQYTITGLQPGTEYAVTLYAVMWDGFPLSYVQSYYEGEMVTTKGKGPDNIPDKPADMELIPASDSIRVTWSPSSGANGYYISWGTSNSESAACTPVYISGQSSSSYTITGLSSGVKYYVFLYAYKSSNGTKSYTVTGNTTTLAVALPQVTGVRQTASGDNSISLSWNSVSGANGYIVYARPVTGGVGPYESYEASGTSKTLNNLKSQCEYEVCVVAVNTTTGARGAQSDTVIMSTKMAPVQDTFSISPSGSISMPVGGGDQTITVASNTSWSVSIPSSATWLTATKHSGSGNGSTVLTASANISTSSRTATVTFSYGTAGGKATLTVTQPGQNVNFSISPSGSITLQANGASQTISITSNTSWSVSIPSGISWLTADTKTGSGNGSTKLTASANTSTSSRSTTVTFSYGTSGGKVTLTVTQPGKTQIAPEPPSNIRTIHGSDFINVYWDASPSSDVSGYHVYYNTSTSISTAKQYGGDITNKSVEITGLTPSTDYYVWVAAFNSAGESTWVRSDKITTFEPKPEPATNVAASALSQDSISVTWKRSTSSNVTKYWVYYNISNSMTGTGFKVQEASSDASSTTISGLDAGTKYYIWVVAKSSMYTSEAAGPVTAVTLQESVTHFLTLKSTSTITGNDLTSYDDKTEYDKKSYKTLKPGDTVSLPFLVDTEATKVIAVLCYQYVYDGGTSWPAQTDENGNEVSKTVASFSTVSGGKSGTVSLTLPSGLNSGTYSVRLMEEFPNGFISLRVIIAVQREATGIFMHPVSNVSSRKNGFGSQYANKSYVDDDYGISRRFHLAIDYGASKGTEVKAFADGKVLYVSRNNANGNFVLIEHTISNKTVYSFYAHLNEATASAGTDITAGDKIGTVGNDGTAAGPQDHLHFSIVDTAWSGGGYAGYATRFSGKAVKYKGVTFYDPDYVIDNRALPTSIANAATTEIFDLSPASWTLSSYAGDSKTIEIDSTTKWSVVSNASDWLTVKVTSDYTNCDGSVKLTVAANPDSSSRTGTITFTYGCNTSKTKTLTVVQPGNGGGSNDHLVSEDAPTLKVFIGYNNKQYTTDGVGENRYVDAYFAPGDTFGVKIQTTNCGRVSMNAYMVKAKGETTTIPLGAGITAKTLPDATDYLNIAIPNDQKPGVYEVHVYASNSTMADDPDSRVKKAHVRFYFYVNGNGTYNADDAVEYAKKWVKNLSSGTDSSYYNPGYSNWNSGGGDCANYVSQCLLAGGIKMNAKWGVDIAGPWLGAPSLLGYLKGLSYPCVPSPSLSDLHKGDIIFSEGRSKDGTTTKDGHVMIVTSVSGTSFTYCGHNRDQNSSSSDTSWLHHVIQMGGN